MTRFTRIASAFWLALALLLGQQAAALHALTHATEQLSQKKDSQHLPASCDKCFACAELSGAVGPSIPSIAVLDCDASVHHAFAERLAASAPRLAYRSQAPPSTLV
jgi:hypothetical protein